MNIEDKRLGQNPGIPGCIIDCNQDILGARERKSTGLDWMDYVTRKRIHARTHTHNIRCDAFLQTCSHQTEHCFYFSHSDTIASNYYYL